MKLKVRGLLSALLPTRCVACEQPNANTGLCVVCASYLSKSVSLCPSCGLETPDMGVCGHCLNAPPQWDSLRTSGYFHGLRRFLIHQFKYQRDLVAGDALVQAWLAINHDAFQPDALLPVPMHHRKRFERGGNQADWLANAFSEKLNIPVWRGIERITQTEPLEGLSKQERKKMVKGVFERTRSDTPNSVAIVDDVVTSGATAAELTLVLKRAGVRYVAVWALARTPPFNGLS